MYVTLVTANDNLASAATTGADVLRTTLHASVHSGWQRPLKDMKHLHSIDEDKETQRKHASLSHASSV